MCDIKNLHFINSKAYVDAEGMGETEYSDLCGHTGLSANLYNCYKISKIIWNTFVYTKWTFEWYIQQANLHTATSLQGFVGVVIAYMGPCVFHNVDNKLFLAQCVNPDLRGDVPFLGVFLRGEQFKNNLGLNCWILISIITIDSIQKIYYFSLTGTRKGKCEASACMSHQDEISYITRGWSLWTELSLC